MAIRKLVEKWGGPLRKNQIPGGGNQDKLEMGKKRSFTLPVGPAGKRNGGIMTRGESLQQ